ncbi:hypothetical protein ABE402_13700 [Bacillus smithii]|uniref:hypothetical protein n=1 Tax=Bacillus smithii TaxID=1479 RepID=UPI003D214A76
MKDVIIDLLRSDGSIVVNKRLAKAIGLTEAVVYSELVSLYKYWANRGELTDGEWFFCTDDNLVENTTIPKNTVRRKVNELVKMGLIEKELKGLPAKIHYRITDKIFEVLGLWSSKDNQNGQPDEINVSDEKSAEKPHGYQLTQNGQPRVTKMDKQGSPKWSPNNTKLNNTKINNTNKIRERYLIKGAEIEEELKDYIEERLEEFEKKGIDLQTVINWIEANKEFYSFSEFAVGINQLLEFPEPIKNPIRFLNSTFAEIEKYVKDFRKKQMKKGKKEMAAKKKQQPQFQPQPQTQTVFYNWLEQ